MQIVFVRITKSTAHRNIFSDKSNNAASLAEMISEACYILDSRPENPVISSIEASFVLPPAHQSRQL